MWDSGIDSIFQVRVTTLTNCEIQPSMSKKLQDKITVCLAGKTSANGVAGGTKVSSLLIVCLAVVAEMQCISY